MGTRADFYVGRDEAAEWIGSIGWDGYRDGIDKAVLNARTEADYREAVAAFFATRDDVTLPDQGWPWPRDNSGTTDCSYWFFDGQVWDDAGDVYQSCLAAETEEAATGPQIKFPDMSARKNVTYGSRSGLLIFCARGD